MTETATEKPQAVPGMYPTMGWGEYAKVPAMSKSLLEYGMLSMRHLRAARDGLIVRKETDALYFGRALHCRLLEPVRFKEEFAVLPEFEQDTPGKYKNYKSTNEYNAKASAWSEENEGKIVISQGDSDLIEAMAKTVYAHKAVKLMHAAGGCEHSMVWTDPGTGIHLKGRMDKYCPAFGRKKIPTIIDLKTCRSCDPDSLSRDVDDYGYTRQISIYMDGVKELTGETPDFLLIFVEKTFPHAVAVRRMGFDSVELGRQQYKSILQQWKMALETGVYPAYGEDIGWVDIPEWKLRRFRMDRPS